MSHTGPLGTEYEAVEERTRLNTIYQALGTAHRELVLAGGLTTFDDKRAKLTEMAADAAFLQSVANRSLVDLVALSILAS